jgi:hypothetical protein
MLHPWREAQTADHKTAQHSEGCHSRPAPKAHVSQTVDLVNLPMPNSLAGNVCFFFYLSQLFAKERNSSSILQHLCAYSHHLVTNLLPDLSEK